MFGQQNDNQDDQKIPEQSIDGVLNDTATSAPASDDQANWQHPGTPLGESNAPAETPAEVVTPDVTTESTTSAAPVSDTLAHDLIDIKQQALQQLSPLVGHLDQSPEEKFRTTMMMIQASDDQNLVKVAYEAANAIEDEKVKAQALLDIVNEINYFTSQHPAA